MRKTRLSLLAVAGVVGCSIVQAQDAGPLSPSEAPTPPHPPKRGGGGGPQETGFSPAASSPGFAATVAPDAELVELARGFGLNEGPAWFPDENGGFVLVSGLLDNVIYKVAQDGEVSGFLDYAGYTGDDPEHVGTQTRAGRSHVLRIGPSCTGRDPQGRLVWCADNDRMVMRLEKDGTRTVLSAGHEGKRFSGPNDIAITRSGAIYLTENSFGLRDYATNPDKQMPDGVFLIRDGRTIRLLDDKQLGGIPNGVALSPDEKYLYLTAGHTLIKRYPIKADGTLGPGADFTSGVGIGDGMKTDTAGNLYSTSGGGPGIVRITSPTGKLLGTINLPIYGKEPKRQICATNVAFGDADGKSLFITACDVLYRIRLKIAGIVPGPG